VFGTPHYRFEVTIVNEITQGGLWDGYREHKHEDDALAPDPKEVEICRTWIREFCHKRQSFNRRQSSYGMKQKVENGTKEYVSNGAFIQAAIEEGYEYRPDPFHPINAQFNMAIGKEKPTARKRLGQDEYMRLMEKCEKKCWICGEEGPVYRELSVDHDHKTGNLRGLLCGKCNTGLGYFKDSPEVLRTAALYIEKAKCKFPWNSDEETTENAEEPIGMWKTRWAREFLTEQCEFDRSFQTQVKIINHAYDLFCLRRRAETNMKDLRSALKEHEEVSNFMFRSGYRMVRGLRGIRLKKNEDA